MSSDPDPVNILHYLNCLRLFVNVKQNHYGIAVKD